MTILELPEEVRDEETAEHEAHGEQGGVGVRSLSWFVVDSDIAKLILQMLNFGDVLEGILQGTIQTLVI